MTPLMMALILAGGNLLKSELLDKPKAEAQQRAEAEKTRWAPFTGMGAGKTVAQPSGIDALLSGGMSGFKLGQAVQDQEAQQKLKQRLLDLNPVPTEELPSQRGDMPTQEAQATQGSQFSMMLPNQIGPTKQTPLDMLQGYTNKQKVPNIFDMGANQTPYWWK